MVRGGKGKKKGLLEGGVGSCMEQGGGETMEIPKGDTMDDGRPVVDMSLFGVPLKPMSILTACVKVGREQGWSKKRLVDLAKEMEQEETRRNYLAVAQTHFRVLLPPGHGTMEEGVRADLAGDAASAMEQAGLDLGETAVKKWSHPTKVACPYCHDLHTVATSTPGATQYRRCRRVGCYRTFKVIGTCLEGEGKE